MYVSMLSCALVVALVSFDDCFIVLQTQKGNIP